MRNKVLENISWIIICRVAQAVLNLAVSMIMARYLGPSNYGLIAYAASMVTFIVPLVQLGMNNILVHEIVNAEDEGEILGTTLTMCICSSFLGILGISAISVLLNYGERDTIIVCVLYSISLLFQMTELIQYWYQAKLKYKYVAITSFFSRCLVSAYKIYLVVSGKSIYWFALVNSLDFLIISVALYFIYSQIGEKKLSFSFKRAKKLIQKGKAFIVPGLMIAVFTQTDKIMLKLMIDDAASGYYSAAVTCVGMTAFVFTAVIDSFRPIIFEKKKHNKGSYEKSLLQLYSIVMYFSLAQSIILTAFASLVINILYGQEFMPAVPILQTIAWYSAFSHIGSAKNIWIICENKQGYLWIINLLGAVINVMGNFVLIPIWGACGAALTSVVTQFTINYLIFIVFKPFKDNGKLLIKCLDPRVLISLVKR